MECGEGLLMLPEGRGWGAEPGCELMRTIWTLEITKVEVIALADLLDEERKTEREGEGRSVTVGA